MEPNAYKRYGVVNCELEAAEALAGLARFAAPPADASRFDCPARHRVTSSTHTPKGQTLAAEQFGGKTSTIVANVLETNGTVRIVPSQLCGNSFPPNSTTYKSRKRLSEAEKDERQLRRVLANRESARQTIRRRQAMHLELNKKAADLHEESKSLKKEKELAMKKYNSLKHKNELLKRKMSKIKEEKLRKMREEAKSSGAGVAGSVAMNTPFLPYNQPILVPSFRDMPFLNGGQDICPGYAGQVNPLFILPVPWFIPCLGPNKAFYPESEVNRGQNDTISARQQNMPPNLGALLFKGYHQPLPNQNSREMVSNSTNAMAQGSACGSRFTSPANGGNHYRGNQISNCTRSIEKLRSGRHSQVDDINTFSASKHLSLKHKKKNRVLIRHKQISEDVAAAIDARRRRKELMTLKNNHFRNFRVHNTK